MAVSSSQHPLEALNKAMSHVVHLRHSFPCKAGKLLGSIDDITDALRKQDQDQYPFNVLVEEINGLAGIVRGEYDEQDSVVQRQDYSYELVLGLEYRFRLSIEFIVTNRIYESVEKRFERIDTVLPPRNYSLRESLRTISVEAVGAATVRRLEDALNYFDRNDYKQALREATEAGEGLFVLYKQHMKAAGCDKAPREQGLALGGIRNWMIEDNADNEGLPFAPRDRVEWFLLAMFETLHYLRNAVSHPPETDERIPEWQRQRRAAFAETPEHARLALCLVFQIVLELEIVLGQCRLPV
jgi:hypothetical protein